MIIAPRQRLAPFSPGQILTCIGERGFGTSTAGAYAVAQRVSAGKRVALVSWLVDDALQMSARKISSFMDGDEPMLFLRDGELRWPKRPGRVVVMGMDDEDLGDRIQAKRFDTFWCDSMIAAFDKPADLERAKACLQTIVETGAEVIWTGQVDFPLKNPSTPAAL